jgi:hypothetical protein
MREIRPSGSEGGVALTPPSLPLSGHRSVAWSRCRCGFLQSAHRCCPCLRRHSDRGSSCGGVGASPRHYHHHQRQRGRPSCQGRHGAQGNIAVTGYSAAWVDGQLFSQGRVIIKYSGSPRLPSPRGYLGCIKRYSPNPNGVAANAAGVLWAARIMAARIIRTGFPSISYTSQVEATESLLGMTRRRQCSRVKSQLRRSQLQPGNHNDSLAASATEDENQSRVSFDDTS